MPLVILSRKRFVVLIALVASILWLAPRHNLHLHGNHAYIHFAGRSSSESLPEIVSRRDDRAYDRHRQLHATDFSKHSTQQLAKSIVSLVNVEEFSHNITLEIHSKVLVKRAVDYNWYKCKGERLLKMLLEEPRPADSFDSDYLRPWRKLENPQNGIQGVNGNIQPVLDSLGYKDLVNEEEFAAQDALQDLEFSTSDGKKHVSHVLDRYPHCPKEMSMSIALILIREISADPECSSQAQKAITETSTYTGGISLPLSPRLWNRQGIKSARMLQSRLFSDGQISLGSGG
ncbi:MAG: hypothetical protein Q9166_007780 [cf. Caloplaca sp. 2 TL-2023]